MLKRRMLFLALLLTAGCASLEQQLAKDVVNAGEVRLNRCEVEGFDYRGLNADFAPGKVVKVLMVHGVGTHHPGYSRKLQQNLANHIGFEVISRLSKNVKLLSPRDGKTPVGNLRVTFWQNRDKTKNMLFYELTWSEITTPYKETLAFDTTEQYSEFRVPFNNTMKKFLDNVLPDPLIYLVDKQDLIQESSGQAFCWMLKTDWMDIPDGKSAVCSVSANDIIRGLAAERVMFVTHSLGSEIVMNTITQVAENLEQVKDIAALQKLQQKEITLFMLANQLPMLLIDTPLPKVHNQFAAYCTRQGADYEKRLFKAVNIVAFSDPNDILSYAIPQTFADKHIDSRICPRVTNVSVNVAPEISAFGVGIVNPITAHTAYDSSLKVINLITGGTDGFHKDGLLKKECRFLKMLPDKEMTLRR